MFDGADEAMHAAAEAFAAEHSDEPTCEYCNAYGHTQDTCEVLDDDKLIIAEDQARRAAQYFGIEDDDDTEVEDDYDDPWDNGEFTALGDGWFEDLEGNSFRLDPTKAAIDHLGNELKCDCNDRAFENECAYCDVGRMDANSKWRPFRYDNNYEVYNSMGRKNRRKNKGAKQAQKALPFESTTTSTTTSKPTTTTKSTTTTTYGKDSHFADPYTTYDGKLTFYLTSGRAGGNNRKEGEFVPDWGLYFDWSWRPWWRAEHIDWKDFGLPEAWDIAFEQLTVAIEKAASGKKVEMGCIGAHGRTGTALAAINVILGCDAKEAIKHVRENHCHHAIENKTQEWWVEWVESQVKGTPCPPRPTTPAPKASTTTSYGGTSTYSYGSSATGGDCTQQDHYDYWLWLPPEKDGGKCPRKGDKCTWWEADVETFWEGKFITWADDAHKKTPISGTTTVRGYLVPSPNYAKGEKAHNITKFNQGFCDCDTCRYLDHGYGALLRPSDAKLGREWDEAMWELESEAKLAVAARKIKAIAALDLTGLQVEEPHEETIKIAGSDGEIIEVAITPDFEPKPPTDTPAHGTVKGEFTYINGEGWVWTGQLANSK